MSDRAREFKRHCVCWLAGWTGGGGGGEGARQQSVASAAEQTSGDSWAPSFTTVIRSSRTAHHMGWHNLFIQSLGLHAGTEEGTNGVCQRVCTCEGRRCQKMTVNVKEKLRKPKKCLKKGSNPSTLC